jgi:hypothetical protein
LPPTRRRHILQPALRGIVGIQVLQIFKLAIAELSSGVDESILGLFGAVSAAGDIDWPGVAMVLALAAAVVGFELEGKMKVSINLFKLG